MAKTGAVTAEKAESALPDILTMCRGPCFGCSCFLEGLVDTSPLSDFKSACGGRNAPFPHHLRVLYSIYTIVYKTTLVLYSSTLPRLGIRRGRLVREENFSFLSISITSLQGVLLCGLLFLPSASVRAGWFDLPRPCPQSGAAFVLPSYLLYQYSCTGTSFACRKGCRDRLN